MAKSPLERFRVEGLYGGTTLDLPIRDNTLVLVGENGSGKTTLLRILFYFISGKWGSLSQFNFTTVRATFGGKEYSVDRSDLINAYSPFDREMIAHLPPSLKRQVNDLRMQGRYEEAVVQAERALARYGMGPSLFPDLTDSPQKRTKAGKALSELHSAITDAVQAQILYLPTYRRIERELSSIFEGVDMDDVRRSRNRPRQVEDGENFIELVEFGMADVKGAIERTIEKLRDFARVGATRLTLGYLGDVVSQSYREITRNQIASTSPERVSAVLNRIDESILSNKLKSQLQEIILSARATTNTPSDREQIIYHYFTRLLDFQTELQLREKRIRDFCDLCSTYIVDKKFVYEGRDFSFRIDSARSKEPVELAELSSGEKQIVSLFSHLYLSDRDKFFVMIDEPELSLSVPWQRRFLEDIWAGDFCAGLIAVTHSPFIYDNKLRSHTHALGEFVRGSDWGSIR